MGVSGELLTISAEQIDASAVAVYYVDKTNLREVFQFQTDSSDVDFVNDSTDVKYFVKMQNWTSTAVINPAHAMMDANESNSPIASGFANDRSLVKHDFVRYLAEQLFNTHRGVDLFSNENELKDDLAENIFINSLRGRNILDLEVMKVVGTNYNFDFYRPLLIHFKKEIFYFAHKYDIPYLLDTTPKWSNRGIMRNIIFCLLDNILGCKWKEKLLKLGYESRQLNQVVSDKIIKPWLNLVEYEYEDDKCVIKIPIYHVDKEIIWSILIKKIFNNMEINTLKDKSITRILQHLNNYSDNMITLDKNRYGKIEDNKFVIFINNLNV
jgi:hypothetical protein